ncbi:hypothetical protein IAD21_02657 [Abditibacteriota bacterium]|nr:hypothetical protein IAD21_02657 [Abditibacteriota bacterium]
MPIELGIFLIVGLIVWFAIYSHQEERRKLRALQLSDIDNMTGYQFEHYVAKLLTCQGFSTQVTVASGDLGIDVMASRGGTKYAIQVKRQTQNVSRRAVSDAVAGKIHYRCTDAMVVTNAFFTLGATELAKSTKCRLVDRTELTQWILSLQNDRPYSAASAQPPSKPPITPPSSLSPDTRESLIVIGEEYFLRNPGPVVYLLQHGNRQEYKIGFSKDINARIDKIDLQMPEKIYVVHKIYTNDPRWLEEIWHKRFASKRKNGEWFDLSVQDIAEFKSSDRTNNPAITYPSQLSLPIEEDDLDEKGKVTFTHSVTQNGNSLEFSQEVKAAIKRVEMHFDALKSQNPEYERKLDKACTYQISLVNKDVSLWDTRGLNPEKFLANWEPRAKKSGDAKIV